MIDNKLVTIVRDNQFDKGWTLFSPTFFEVERNWKFKKVILSDVIKLITFSKQVNLILTEACLPSRIVSELEWSNKYININIIAKNEMVLERYKDLSFNSCQIDVSVSVNYIGVTGKDSGYYIFGEDLVEIDDSIEKFYFNSTKPNDNQISLEKVKTLIICNSGEHHDFSDILSLAKKYNIVCSYLVSSQHFNRKAYDFAKNNGFDLYIAERVDNAIISINKDNSISKLTFLNSGYVFLFPIEKINNHIVYKNLFLDDTVEVNKLPSTIYSCLAGINKKLNITDLIVIKIDVPIREMSDFIEENFDNSIVDSHNDYSNKARAVEYQFTLIPPLFDSSYHESSIYIPIHQLHDEWKEINSIKFNKIVKDYYTLMDKNAYLINFINYSKNLARELTLMVNNCFYKNYYSKLDEAINVYEEYQSKIFDDCLFMFNEVNLESSNVKFDKFDVELEGYKKTIQEKEALVSNSIDVLNNKRRIEILNKKIEELLNLKEKFKKNANERSNKEVDSFLVYCKNLVNGVFVLNGDNDSIDKIINTSEKSKLTKLNNFMQNYLKQISDYLTKCIAWLKNMRAIHIPEEYPVYEKDNQKFIIIDDLNEFESTKELREEFALKCLARR